MIQKIYIEEIIANREYNSFEYNLIKTNEKINELIDSVNHVNHNNEILVNTIIDTYRNRLSNYKLSLQDLIDLTKGIDDDGTIYNTAKIDYKDIEKVLKRRDIKLWK